MKIMRLRLSQANYGEYEDPSAQTNPDGAFTPYVVARCGAFAYARQSKDGSFAELSAVDRFAADSAGIAS